jgi:hypothetical protein
MADIIKAAQAAAADPVTGIQKFFETHIAPDVERAKDDLAELKPLAARLVAYTEAHSANVDQLANVVLKLVQSADPASAPLIAALQAEITRVAAEAKRIAVEFTGQPGAA